ncbi:hypothetical protein [Streptomyces roseirectus]|uniref:hypothetical protein n=1 Tax=Streptomyces roseirectus TaxID=2768066 RepID=UPI001FE67132|nr:hypothetical protein [Streptomyces roseirectus]
MACLHTLLDLVLPATGKRRSPSPVTPPAQPEPYVSPWSRPWTSPGKADAVRELQEERRRAAAYASLGIDYPYTYDGAPFAADSFPTTPGLAA